MLPAMWFQQYAAGNVFITVLSKDSMLRERGTRTLGPNVTPPPGNSGDLLLPRLALPVPFCLYGFLPPPRTSLRVSVLAVPCSCNKQQ